MKDRQKASPSFVVDPEKQDDVVDQNPVQLVLADREDQEPLLQLVPYANEVEMVEPEGQPGGQEEIAPPGNRPSRQRKSNETANRILTSHEFRVLDKRFCRLIDWIRTQGLEPPPDCAYPALFAAKMTSIRLNPLPARPRKYGQCSDSE